MAGIPKGVLAKVHTLFTRKVFKSPQSGDFSPLNIGAQVLSLNPGQEQSLVTPGPSLEWQDAKGPHDDGAAERAWAQPSDRADFNPSSTVDFAHC